MREFWISNATAEPLNTFWEPYCGEGGIAAGAGRVRVEWTETSQGAGMIYDPGLVVIWDLNGSCRAWEPDGTETFTGGTYLYDPDGRFVPHPVPGWPTSAHRALPEQPSPPELATEVRAQPSS